MESLIEIEAELKVLKHDLKQEKKRQHNIFFNNHAKLFYMLDVIVILCVIMNFGALILTNIMVSEVRYEDAKAKGVEVVYHEVNKVQAKANNFQSVEDLGLNEEELKKESEASQRAFMLLFKQGFFWSLLLTAYVINRNKIYDHKQMGILIFVVFFYFSILGYDFYHDLGLYIGKVLFG